MRVDKFIYMAFVLNKYEYTEPTGETKIKRSFKSWYSGFCGIFCGISVFYGFVKSRNS